MARVVGVRFKQAGKTYYFEPISHNKLQPGDQVIVETSRGKEIGEVVIAERDVSEE